MYGEIREYLKPSSGKYPNVPRGLRFYCFGFAILAFLMLWLLNSLVLSMSLKWWLDPGSVKVLTNLSEAPTQLKLGFYSIEPVLGGLVVAVAILRGSYDKRTYWWLIELLAIFSAPVFFLYVVTSVGNSFCPENSIFYKFCAMSFEIPLFTFIATGKGLSIFIIFSLLASINMFTALLPFAQLRRSVKSVIREKDFRKSSESDLLNKEESLTHEYKSSFQTPLEHPLPTVIEDGRTLFIMGRQKFKSMNEVKSFLQTQCLKTVVGFLNSKGGTLVVGVHESGRENNYLGVEREIGFGDADQFERHFVQQIINRIGARFASNYIETKFIVRDEKIFFVVFVDKYIPSRSEIPAMLDGKEVYRRTGPRTDKVPEGEELLRFVTERQISG